MVNRMDALLIRLRTTKASKVAGSIRFFLGLLFLSTGLMKLVVPTLRNAFSGQLAEAGLPLHALNMWLVPLTEVAVGVMLLAGLFGRVASLVAIGMMMVATYVHLVVHNPELFPLQPEAPIMPLVVIVLSLYVLKVGSGSWSLDLKQQESSASVMS